MYKKINDGDVLVPGCQMRRHQALFQSESTKNAMELGFFHD